MVYFQGNVFGYKFILCFVLYLLFFIVRSGNPDESKLGMGIVKVLTVLLLLPILLIGSVL